MVEAPATNGHQQTTERYLSLYRQAMNRPGGFLSIPRGLGTLNRRRSPLLPSSLTHGTYFLVTVSLRSAMMNFAGNCKAEGCLVYHQTLRAYHSSKRSASLQPPFVIRISSCRRARGSGSNTGQVLRPCRYLFAFAGRRSHDLVGHWSPSLDHHGSHNVACTIHLVVCDRQRSLPKQKTAPLITTTRPPRSMFMIRRIAV